MMLHSWKFLFGILPAALVIVVGLARFLPSSIVVFLIGVSLFFAAAVSASDALIILSSTLFNFCLVLVMRARLHADLVSRCALAVGITTNIALLAYFKYFNFLADNVNLLLGSSYQPTSLGLLPLGLSFLTFQQIAFLVDQYREKGMPTEVSFSHYLLFCSFFPKQAAGPIIRAREFFPQIAGLSVTIHGTAFLEGLTRLIIGYFEKVVVADTLSLHATAVFNAASAGKPLGFVAAWGGVLAFTFQLYFDFAGYSNMAIGVARMVGFTLPENFMSPYKAVSIIDFWRRWHMTLSRFLRDYLYIPLGGNRKGFVRQLVNMMITMILGGLWHGASWMFVMWGTLHGLYLCVNHIWRQLGGECADKVGWLLTFLGVVYAWVWFRADSLVAALNLSKALVGAQGLWTEGLARSLVVLQTPMQGGLSSIAEMAGLLDLSLVYDRWKIYPVCILLSEPMLQLAGLVAAAIMVWRLPNAQEWLEQLRRPSCKGWSAARGGLLALLLFVALLVSLQGTMSTIVYSKF